MSFTAKQKKLFHTAAARHAPGRAITKFADAGEEPTIGSELQPTGVGGTAAHILSTLPDEDEGPESVTGTRPWSRLRGKK